MLPFPLIQVVLVSYLAGLIAPPLNYPGLGKAPACGEAKRCVVSSLSPPSIEASEVVVINPAALALPPHSETKRAPGYKCATGCPAAGWVRSIAGDFGRERIPPPTDIFLSPRLTARRGMVAIPIPARRPMKLLP